MSKTKFSTPADKKLAKQLFEQKETRWRDWQMELLVRANKQNWESLEELIRRGPATTTQLGKGPTV